jgi:hypothetical protein
MDSANKSDACYIIQVHVVDETCWTGSECHLHKPYWLAPCYWVFPPSSLHKPSTWVPSWFFGLLTPEDGLTGCPIMSLRNYHYSLCNDQEQHSSQMHTDCNGGIIKPILYVTFKLFAYHTKEPSHEPTCLTHHTLKIRQEYYSVKWLVPQAL